MSLESARRLLAGLLVLGLGVAVYAADMLTLVKEKSQIEFVGTKPGGAHRGGFSRFTVDSTADLTDLSKSSFKVDIDATSLWSDNGALTGHLKNADFIDVSRYPNIMFETTRIELRGANQAIVTGTLTMRGKAVELSAPANIEVTDGGLQVKADFKIDRMQWGMTYGKGRIDDDVRISARLVFGR